MGPDHERFLDLDAGPVANVEQRPRFGGRERDRLLAKDVLPASRGPDRPGHVQMIGQRVVDGIDLPICEQRLQAEAGGARPEPWRDRETRSP